MGMRVCWTSYLKYVHFIYYQLHLNDGEGNGNPLQYSCLENPMDRGAWQAIVHGVTIVGHDLVIKPPPTSPYLNEVSFKNEM